MKESGVDYAESSGSEDEDKSVEEICRGPGTTKRKIPDYFATAKFLIDAHRLQPDASSKIPLQTFSVRETAFHLNAQPKFKKMGVDEVADLFEIPDLLDALGTLHAKGCAVRHRLYLSDWRAPCCLTTQPRMAVWTKVRIQNKSYHPPHSVLPPQTMNATPPGLPKMEAWTDGRYDAAVAKFDPAFSWPQSGLQGHQVVEIRLIFCVITNRDQPTPPGINKFLTYDIVPQVNKEISGSTRRGIYPNPVSSLFLLRRAERNNGQVVGDILTLDQVRAQVDLVPNFGEKANLRLTSYNASHFFSEFWLNKYFDKEMYLALSSA